MGCMESAWHHGEGKHGYMYQAEYSVCMWFQMHMNMFLCLCGILYVIAGSFLPAQSEAIQQYCSTVEQLESADQGSAGREADTSSDYHEIVVSDDGGARTILLNRPHKYNAITLKV